MNSFELSCNSVVRNFSPILRENIREMLSDVCFGLRSLNLKINSSISRTSHGDYLDNYADSMIVEIPYAGVQLEWEIIFQEEDFSYPPDFDFINDIFLLDPDVNVISDHIPALANWNVKNCKSLKNVIKELLTLYKTHQVMKLQSENKYSRLFDEYKSLTSTNISENDVEICVENTGVVYFLISITVDFSCLPPYVQPAQMGKEGNLLNPHTDFAALKLTFYKPDYTKVHGNLYLSPRLEQTIGNASNLRIPSYNKDTILSNYVKEITKLLKDRVQQVAIHHKMKNAYIIDLVTKCGCSAIEYDNMLFSKATLLLNVNTIYAIVSITIGNKFPQEKPKVVIRSVYNLQNDKPYIQNLEHYPYSPQWKTVMMVKELLNYLQEQIPKFQATAQHHFNI